VTDELAVHISREKRHVIEVAPSFDATGSFDIRLINHGTSLHVHLHLDDSLSEVAAVDAGNHYVESESERRVRVTVDTDSLDGEELLGKLKIASAYGAETRWVDIDVSEPEPERETVIVDESLARPPPTEPSTEPVVANPVALVLGLALVALLVAGLVVLLVDDPFVVTGSLVVVGGVLVALVFLLRG